MKKTIIPFIFLISALLLSLIFINSKKDLVLNCKSALVINLDKDKILFEKNIDSRLIPGSLTKLMSVLLIFEIIEEGQLSYEDLIPISPNATGTFASKAGLIAGEKIVVDDLIKCILLPSGSDAVIAIAEYLYGSEEAFVNEMNKKAREMGLENTNFTNPVGLEGVDHFSTASDLSLIALDLISRYPEVYEYTSLHFTTIKHEDGSDLFLKNTNDMLGTEGIVGLKTGSTPNGGYSLVMSYRKANKNILYIVIGSDSLYFRKQDCKKLLEKFN